MDKTVQPVRRFRVRFLQEMTFFIKKSSIQPLLISVGLIFFGLFLCLCGYRAFRFNLWFSGFNFSFWCVLAICNRVENLPNGANWGAAFSVGTLAGCVTHLLPGVGTFLWGVYSGKSFSGSFFSIFSYFRCYSNWCYTFNIGCMRSLFSNSNCKCLSVPARRRKCLWCSNLNSALVT